MPAIGAPSEVWQEYLDVRLDLQRFVTDDARESVDGYLQALQPGPVVLVHTQGNTAVESKNMKHEQALSLYRPLLDLTDATLILLDWDARVPRLASHRVRHLTDDWHRLSSLELDYLITRDDLLVGVDSGPIHFCRFTDTPAIGLWTHHYPSHFVLPRNRTLNITPSDWREPNKYRRVAYQIVECPQGGRQLDGRFIGEQAAAVLAGPRWLSREWIARDVQLQQWLSWTRGRQGHLGDYVDRHRSFALVLDHLSKVNRPIMVETGCIRAEEDWCGAGFSTYLFGAALEALGGELHSIELNPTNVRFAREWTRCFGETVIIHQGHSHQWLDDCATADIDVFYSDSADIGTAAHQENCLGEVQRVILRLQRRRLMKTRSLDELASELADRRGVPIRVVFTNGCFDVLHAGHVRSLREARHCGDLLIVGLNSDQSVRDLKGPGRPINCEGHRAEVLGALEAVDYIVVFDEPTPLRLIEALRPDVLVKGADYRGTRIAGQDVVESYGGRVVLLDLVEGLSTTRTLERMAESPNRAA